MVATKTEKEIPWFLAALSKGIDSVEGVVHKDDNIYISFSTDTAPISDLLEVIARMADLEYSENSIISREGKGPEVEFCRV